MDSRRKGFIYYIFQTLWSWSYGSWIFNYLCNQCLSPLKLWVRTRSWRRDESHIVLDNRSKTSEYLKDLPLMNNANESSTNWNQCLSPLTLRVQIQLRRGVLNTTLCDKVCQWLVAGLWFSPGTPVSSTDKTDHHDITEILLKVAFNTINLTNIFHV
jgi:hypothetical protein